MVGYLCSSLDLWAYELGTPRPILCDATPSPRVMREMLVYSFYMKSCNYFLCLGCLCIRDNTEWFAWKENEKKLSGCEVDTAKSGQQLKA